MAFQIPTIKYSGAITEVVLGQGPKALTVGGETCYPFHAFEGKAPRRPVVGMEVWDIEPDEWPAWARAPFEGVLTDPVAWARKCVAEYGADFICLSLRSTDPNDKDAPAKEAAATAKKVVEAVDVPVFVWGTANPPKDAEVLAAVAEACQGKNVILGPVEDKNHKQVGAQAMAYKHNLAANSPIDVNLAKQLNILLGNLGVPMDKILIDPTTGSLGYGLEYCYSVMERIRMAALTQDDDKLTLPIVNYIGAEVWKTKEAKTPLAEAPELGDPSSRAVLMEAITAVSVLLAGSDVLILRHPETVRLVKNYISLLAEGDASQAAERRPADQPVPAAEALPREEAKAPAAKAAPGKPAAKPAPEPPKAAPKPEAKPAPEPPKTEMKPAAPAAPKLDAEAEAAAKAKAEAEAKAKAEAEAKAKVEAAAKAKAEAEARAKAEAEARAKAEAEAKAKAEAEAKRQAEEELEAVRARRRAEREKASAEQGAEGLAVPKTAAQEQFGQVDKMMFQLDRVHRRNIK